MEEKHSNSKSHTCLGLDMSHSWSELPLDLLILVFERLSYANFQRAKTVCSSWYSASRQTVPQKNQIHWMILFPKDKDDNNNNNSCMLFNPEEKDKVYKTQDLGVEFAKSKCIATYGSWILMQNLRDNLYIMNIFPLERIDLPDVESQIGMVRVIRSIDASFHIFNGYIEMEFENMNIRSPVFWIDDKTKDYVLLWGLGFWCVSYSKKGDNLWNQVPDILDCAHMFYKDHKLYFFSYRNIFTITDFSGEIPQHTFQCGMFASFDVWCIDDPWVINSQLVVTVTGDVLKVDLSWSEMYGTYSFIICKVYSSGLPEKIEVINSLGDETMLFDQGITVLANDTNGFIRNSIYFGGNYGKSINDMFIFNLTTLKTELLHKFDSSSLQFSRGQWFFPSCTHA